MRRAATGGYWTAREFHRRGFPVGPECPFCRGEGDSVWHRVWVCSARRSERQQTVASDLVARAIRAGPSDLRYARGLWTEPVPLEARRLERPDAFEYHWAIGERTSESHEELFDGSESTIYVGGSAIDPGEPLLATAAFSAAQV